MLNSAVGSLVGFNGNNPMFNVVDLDEETMLPLNIHAYAFDLVIANSEG